MRVGLFQQGFSLRSKPNITTIPILISFAHFFILDLSPFLLGIISITLNIIFQDKIAAF